MGNFNSLVAKYLQNHSEASIDSVKAQMKKLEDSIQGNAIGSNNSIFSYDGEIDKDKLTEFINSQSNGTNVDNEISVLFEILDADGSGSIKGDELDVMKRSNGSIDTFSIWNMTSMDEGTISSLLTDSSSSTSSSDDTDTSGSVSDTSGSTTTTSDEIKPKTNDELKDLASSIRSNGENIEDYKSQLTASDYEALVNFYNALEDDLDVQATGTTEETEETEETTTTATTETEETEEVETVKVNIEQCADDLFNAMDGLGTDEDELKSILFDKKISDEDFVAIIAKYEEKYGSDVGGVGLVTRIEQETSGDLQVQLTKQLGKRLAKAADGGNEDAITVLCKEIYSGTAGQFCTANDFLEAVFSKETSDDTIAKINDKYGQINKGRSLVDDIKNDYAGIFGWRKISKHIPASGEGANMIARIKEAARHYVPEE